MALLRCCSWSFIVCNSFFISFSLSESTGSWEWKLRSTFFILGAQSRRGGCISLPHTKTPPVLCFCPPSPSLGGSRLSSFGSPHVAFLKAKVRLALQQCRDPPNPPVCATTPAQCDRAGGELWWNGVLCAHLFMMSSCFSLASSYLSAKRSAISRKLFLHARERCFFTLDLHASQVCKWKQEKGSGRASWSREWTCCLITAGNTLTSPLFHPGPGMKYSLRKGPPLLMSDLATAGRLYSPFLSTVIEVFQLFLLLSPQQLHSSNKYIHKMKLPTTAVQLNQDLGHTENMTEVINAPGITKS